MENQVIRTNYLNQLKEFREKSLIKVITGVRRCGKSVLMEQFQNELKKDGVKDGQIISLNFEKLENEELLDYKKLHDYISSRLNKSGWTYVFLDEIQMVQDFQKTVNSLHTKKTVDIYITGSNSYLLSGELATLLSGRFIQLHMFPLSFYEYLLASEDIYEFVQSKYGKEDSKIVSMVMHTENNKEVMTFVNEKGLQRKVDLPPAQQWIKDRFNNYMKYGGFPQILELKSEKAIYDYLDSVYNSVVVKDICGREKSVDVGVLASITKFIFHNVGSLVSSTTIANTLTSNKRKTSYNTVEKYLGFLKDSFIIYEAGRYDVKGKQHLKQTAKYYAVDSGLKNMLLANKDTNIGHRLENIVYLELLRRGYKVSVGKVDNKEVDFVAQKNQGIEYYQVAASVLDENTLARELEPLNNTKDHFPKFLITLDDYTTGTTYNGIKVINAIDFLLKEAL